MELRQCRTCHLDKPVTEFSVNRARKDGLTGDCRECNREKCRRYRQANLERERERKRERQRRWRLEHPDEARSREQARLPSKREDRRARHRRYKDLVLGRYGRQCACCGSANRLSIDHVNGGGTAHRAEIGARSALEMYRWLIANDFPDGFQTLCGSCNASKAQGDRCRLVHN